MLMVLHMVLTLHLSEQALSSFTKPSVLFEHLQKWSFRYNENNIKNTLNLCKRYTVSKKNFPLHVVSYQASELA